MRPGDIITGTNGTATVTAMQFQTSFRQTNSEMVLVVIGRTSNGKKHNMTFQRFGPVNPTAQQVANAQILLEEEATTAIEARLSQ